MFSCNDENHSAKSSRWALMGTTKAEMKEDNNDLQQ